MMEAFFVEYGEIVTLVSACVAVATAAFILITNQNERAKKNAAWKKSVEDRLAALEGGKVPSKG